MSYAIAIENVFSGSMLDDVIYQGVVGKRHEVYDHLRAKGVSLHMCEVLSWMVCKATPAESDALRSRGLTLARLLEHLKAHPLPEGIAGVIVCGAREAVRR